MPDEAVPSDQDEAVDGVEGGEPVGIPSIAGLLKGLGSALVQPGPVTRGVGRLARNRPWPAAPACCTDFSDRRESDGPQRE
jgi:hypothetical protein